jgi:hypothetical protein
MNSFLIKNISFNCNFYNFAHKKPGSAPVFAYYINYNIFFFYKYYVMICTVYVTTKIKISVNMWQLCTNKDLLKTFDLFTHTGTAILCDGLFFSGWTGC